ncbi:hypothetical protein [uncultured Anaerococcus sp.]|uniref:hypothetical protein n=1 Tax=uncultured Anaerococcus sp. TaxID=293428 RepID=UPI00288A692A|nr:hypothetical protein [uncultured Anaerococcus sp.]
MKLTNKKIIAALLIAATFTGCDSLKNKPKDAEENKAEEKVAEEKATEETSKKEGKEDAENTGSTEGAEGKDAAETDKGLSEKEQLEDSIFTNRVQARACEILLQEASDSLTDETKEKLQELMDESNQLIEEAESLVDQL